jgi:hypothetical protein
MSLVILWARQVSQAVATSGLVVLSACSFDTSDPPVEEPARVFLEAGLWDVERDSWDWYSIDRMDVECGGVNETQVVGSAFIPDAFGARRHLRLEIWQQNTRVATPAPYEYDPNVSLTTTCETHSVLADGVATVEVVRCDDGAHEMLQMRGRIVLENCE